MNAGKAGIIRARGYRKRSRSNATRNNRERCNDNSSSCWSMASGNFGAESTARRASPPANIRQRRGDVPIESSGDRPSQSIAGLLGLDDEFRIAGSFRDSEDEVREVQLRGLSGRIMRSPCLVIFPARKESNDVMEHYEGDQLPHLSAPDVPGDRFEIGDLEDHGSGNIESGDVEMTEQFTSSSGEASGEASAPPSTESPAELQRSVPLERDSPPLRRQPSSAIEDQVDEIIHTINDGVTTLRRAHILDGWNVDSSPEKMKDILLLGLRVGFCGALSTFSSLNASVIRLLRAGSVGEALFGYTISVQMGIVSYRFGQHCAVYAFVWRCRREARRDERRGYGLRLRSVNLDEDVIPPRQEGSAQWRFMPSVRTIATLLFLAMFVSLSLAIYFSKAHRQYWCR